MKRVSYDKLAIAAAQNIKERDYWLEEMSGNPGKSYFPYDYQITNLTGRHLDKLTIEFPERLSYKLIKLSNRSDLRLHIIFVAGLMILLNKYTGNKDIIIGMPICKQNIEGEFINTVLPIRTQLEDDITFIDFLLQVKQVIYKATENQDYPIKVLLNQLGMTISQNDFPLFDIIILLENIHEKKYIQHINANIIFIISRRSENLELVLEYNSMLFRKETIEYITTHFTNLLANILTNVENQVSDIKILSREETKKLLFEFNNNRVRFPRNKIVFDIFENQVQRKPDHIAIKYNDECLTYQEMENIVNQLANYLNSQGKVQPDQCVGILMDRSIEMLVAIMGVWKSGAAYVPIDGSTPEQRIKRIINDAIIHVILSQKRYIKTLNKLQWESKCLDTFLCMDTMDIYSEKEREKSELMDKDLWEFIGASAPDDIFGGGWISSYTGEPFTTAEVAEFVGNTIKKVAPILHKGSRVLEIGCATGFTMYRIAPLVGFYLGSDLSRVIIEKNEKRIREERIQNIELACLPAHDIYQVDEKNFDLIIINSVIQDFHGHNYLRKVIKTSIGLLKQKGCIFIGDIMDQDLKKEMIHELSQFKQANQNKNYRTKLEWSTELFISRAFIEDLQIEIPEISYIDFSNKIYTIENELTKFRYDAMITIDKTKTGAAKNKIKHKFQHDLRELKKYQPGKVRINVKPDNLAYVIYTSGSTGKPKGVMIHHQGMLNHLYAKINDLAITAKDIIAQTASASFDISVWQFFAGLLTGGTTFIIAREIVLSPREFLKLVQKEMITIWESVPSLVSAFLQMVESEEKKGRELNHLRWMIITGEPLTPGLARNWFYYYPGIKLLNAYGPTEASDDVTHYVVNEVPLDTQLTVPIGKPLQNTHIYILDRNLSLCPIGVTGEICVAGLGVGSGYWKDPDKTKKSFIPNPFLEEIGDMDYAVLYKTGDIGYLNADGYIECLGRMDDQVKIRGNRVELGEIENRLQEHNELEEALVLAKENERGEKYLYAYIVVRRKTKDVGRVDGMDSILDSDVLRDYLSEILPEYMIPSYFVAMDKIPLTPNGKIDRKALPEPETALNANNYKAPRNEPEKNIASIWQEVLGLDRIGIDDNFFDLGGDSITAIRVTTRMTKAKLDLTVDKLFLHQTIRKIFDNEFQKKGQKEVYAAGEILKTKENYRRITANLMDLKDELTEPEQQEIISNININDELSRLLKKNKIANQYQLAPVQRSFLLSSHDWIKKNIILCPYDFNQFNDVSNLKNLIIMIINENSLLKSIIVKEKNTYLIREFHSFSNVEIPFIDISRYSHKCREKILYMVKQKLYEHFEIFNHLLYRVIAVKLDHNKYKVFFAFNHLIFDGQSVGVLSQKVQTKTDNPRDSVDIRGRKQPAKDYFDYITFLNGLNYENVKLESYLDLQDYAKFIKKAVKKFHIGDLKYDGLEIDIKNLSEVSRDYYNEIILLCYANLIKDLYDIEKVPLIFMSNGRSYKDGNFTDVIGDFHDLIPVLLPFRNRNGASPQETIEEFINYREYIKNHNLNFINYFSKNRQVMETYAKTPPPPFTFNPIIGAYHFYKARYQDQFSKELVKQNIRGPYFELYMSKDFYSTKIFIYYLQNTKFEQKEIKKRFVKNYENLIQQMNDYQRQFDI